MSLDTLAMLSKPNRLPSPDVRRVMQTGRRVNTEGVQLVYKSRVDSGNPEDSRNLQSSRFAFVVPIGIDKHSVVRNRVRRLVRESVRLILPKLAPGRDGVFFVRKVLGDELTGVDAAVREVLRKAGMLNESIIT